MLAGFGVLALITTTIARYCCQQQKEMYDLIHRLDLAEREGDEITDLAENERKCADHFALIYQESEFSKFRKRV